MSDENTFTHEGVEYVAEKADSSRCTGCYFRDKEIHAGCVLIDAEVAPNCGALSRKDRRYIIWKKK